MLALAGATVAAADADSGPAPGPPPLRQHNLTGDWRGVRPALSELGQEPYLIYTTTLWGNLNGGRATGAQVNGYLDFGFDLDLHRLGLWPGLGAHADCHWYAGREPTQRLIGGIEAMALSGWEAAATLRVYNLYLRQAVGEDERFVVKLGQIAADTDFMISRYGGIFLNAAFGDLPSQNLNLDAPVYALAGPGVFLSAEPLPWLKGRFGAYTGDAGNDVAGNHGFQWKLGDNAGYTMFWELAAAAPSTWLPATYTLGAIYDTGGADQFGPADDRGPHYELYGMIDQALLASEAGDAVLGAFLRVAGSTQNVTNVVGFYADAGLTWFGPIPSRPDDVVGLALSVLRYTQDFQQQEQSAGTPVGGGETALELTYQINVTPWLVVQPDAQFFFDPSYSRRDAQALGCEASVVF
ncbi:MAG: carbohydrate porin [Candidatus Binatia bacterium]